MRFAFGLLVCSCSLPFSAAFGEEVRLRASAGDFDRKETVISLVWPGETAGVWTIRAEGSEEARPLQFTADGRAHFIVDALARGEELEFTAERVLEPEAKAAWVEVLPEHGRLRLSVAGIPALFYQVEKRPLPREGLNPLLERGGFLHPVMTPSGVVVSESYPTQHAHHQGIWAPWTRTQFQGRTPDFWNMAGGTGTVEVEAVKATWSGPVLGGFEAAHRFVDLSAEEPVVALDETWSVSLFRVGGADYRLFELMIVQECATEDPLILPEYRYGGLGFRGRNEWIGRDRTFFLTSEGESDRVKGNGTRTRWTHVSGEVDGKVSGIAILGHPGNFRAPQPVRLHPTEPFFCFAPSQLGDWAIEPGAPYVARYRFAVMDGEPEVELIERLWRDFAYPPAVTVIPGGR